LIKHTLAVLWMVSCDVCFNLLENARAVIRNSYAPYSNLHVAAAILTDDGDTYWGVNVENSSYGLTVCAERVAIFNAITGGARRFKMLCLYSDNPEPLVPCGACLQVLAEFVDNAFTICSISLTSGRSVTMKFGDLLPVRFKFKADK